MNFPITINPCRTINKEYETDVQNGLSYSPAEMQKLSEQSRTIKTHELENLQYHDGLPEDADVPRELQRGVDENILWNEAETTKERIATYIKTNRKKNIENEN